MTHQPIVHVDVSRIRRGDSPSSSRRRSALARFVMADTPHVLSYGFFLDPQGTTMTVVSVHPDPESLEFHLDTGHEEFRAFAELVELTRIDVYGHVSEGAVERLHRKAGMLGNGEVCVHEPAAGFAAVSAPPPP